MRFGAAGKAVFALPAVAVQIDIGVGTVGMLAGRDADMMLFVAAEPITL